MSSTTTSVKVRLAAMMFLQFAIHAVWVVQAAGYFTGTLGFTGTETGWVLSTVALGCLLAPIFVGMVADRFFAGEKVLGVLNLAGAALFIVAAQMTNPISLFAVLLIQQICYMPTWGITNAIAMSNCQDTAKDFPKIRVWGSIGWVATGIFGYIALKMNKPFDGTHLPLIVAGIISAIAGVFAFALPHTPPPAAGKKTTVSDVLGLKAIALMKRPSFAIFIIISLLCMIPFSIYFSYCSLFLQEEGFKAITFSMNFGQVAEMFFMLMIPLALARLGVKWAMTTGLAALVVRYAFFYFGTSLGMEWMYFGGIVVHGLIFGFFLVGGQIYIDKKAPREVRAAAQGFIMLVTFGAGMLLGNVINGSLIDKYSKSVEPVVATYDLPATFASDMVTIKNANVSDILLYDRALSGTEIAVLHAQEAKQDLSVKRLLEEAKKNKIAVELEKGKLYSGALAGLSSAKPGKAVTFSAKVELAGGKDSVDGTIFALGQGGSAFEIGIKDAKLYVKAGDAVMSQRIPIARPEKAEDKTTLIVAGTFNKDGISLYSGGKVYQNRDWTKLWGITAICSLVLLVLFVVGFHDKKGVGEETAEEPASDGSAEAVPEAEAADDDEGDAEAGE